MNGGLVLAVSLPFLALALQWLLWPWITPFVWFLFYPAVFFSARLGGLWGGLASTLLSIGLVWFFFIPPALSWTIGDPNKLYSIAMFLLMGYLFSDTHERLRRAQRSTQAELQRYEQIVDTSGDMLAFVDQARRYVTVNPAYAQLFGTTQAQLPGRLVSDLIDAASYARIAPRLGRALAGEVQRFIIEPSFADGQRRVLDAEYRPYWEDGQVQGVVVSLRDITLLKIKEEALKASEARFAKIFQHSPLAIGISEYPNGPFIDVNEALLRLFGYRRAEIIGHSATSLGLWPQPEARAAMIDRLGKQGQIKNLEAQFRNKAGKIGDLLISADIIELGGQTCLLGMLLDITEKKRAEAASQANRVRLEAALASMTDAVFISDLEGRFIDFNDAFATFHKFSDKSACAKTFAEYPEIMEVSLADGTPAPLAQWAVPRALRGEVVTSAEYRLRRKDTGATWIGSYSFAPIRNPDGAIVGSVVTARDITERKAVEDALRNSEATYRSLFDNMLNGFAYCRMLFDGEAAEDFVYLNVNAAFETLTGLREVTGRKVSEVIPGIRDSDQALLDIYGRVSISGQPERFERYVHALRMWFWISVYSPERGYFVAVFDVITERKQAEAAIAWLNADLERRIAERTAELSAANRELDAFAYAVSHDLRTPLRAMSGFSQALAEDYGGQLQGEAKLYLDQIGLASRKMGDLIDGLLALSRSTRGALQYGTVDLSALAQQLLAELAQAEPGRTVAVEVAAGLGARGDARMIEALMRNLLGNAWKYSAHAAAACIRVYATERGGERCFCVADNGAGFDMAHANRLFQPFQRLHRQDEFPGIGIGLATVQRIVQRHGGRIEARAAPGQGAEFCFTLPDRLDAKANPAPA